MAQTNTISMAPSLTKLVRGVLALGIGLLIGAIFLVNPKLQVKEEDIPSHRLTARKLQSKPVVQENKNIDGNERLHYQFQLAGNLFNKDGKYQEITKQITTSLLHSFSPYLEQEAKKRFLDPPANNVYLANSPAVTWYKGDIVLVSRIWLDREKYEEKDNWPPNHFADNYFYTQKFNRQLQPTNNGSILGIPAPKQWWVGDGPIEPRVFVTQNRLLVTFNAAMAFGHKKAMDFTVIWDYDQNLPIIPDIEGGSPMIKAAEPNDMPRDKHWMAFSDDDELYFVHNLDPLRILHCTTTGSCKFVHNENTEGFIFRDHISHLRGGTPFECYQWPYYISVAHSTMYKEKSGRRYYTTHIVVMSVRPYRIVYISDDILINQGIYDSAPMVRAKYIDDGFIFPVGLIIENNDVITVGVHVNDYSSVLIRMRGIEAIMKEVIDNDQAQKPEKGPPVGYVHHYIHDMLEKTKSIKFKDGEIENQENKKVKK